MWVTGNVLFMQNVGLLHTCSSLNVHDGVWGVRGSSFNLSAPLICSHWDPPEELGEDQKARA